MKFRHKIERININGLKEFSVEYFHANELLVGRGASCQIRLASRTVAVQHAKLRTADGGKVVIEDLTKSRGVRVNGSPVDEKELAEGDQVQIGEVVFKTFYDGTYWGWHEVRADVVKETPEDVVKQELKKLDLSRFYPSFTSLSLLVMLLTFLFFFVEPVRGKNKSLWSSGPISNVHRLIADDCTACHVKPFVPVRDQECMSCHSMTDHAQTMPAVMSAHKELDLRCGHCHKDHSGGRAPIEKSSSLCTSCHADLSQVHPGGAGGGVKPFTVEAKVRSFDQHPEFHVSLVRFAEDGKPAVERVSLKAGGRPVDPTALALNHKKHLEAGLRGLPEGKNALACVDCHQLTENRKDVKPVAFDKHCRSCHPLTFDERIPQTEVPHGNAAEVYNFVYAEYAKLFLVSKPENERMATVRRFKPGMTVIQEPDIQFTRDFVESESRNAETTLFTRTACKLCHTITEIRDHPPGTTAFEVVKPHMPARWMPSARFDHGAHQTMTCESCHAARGSTKTEDILMPSAVTCKTCHTAQRGTAKVSSPCISCHSFHDPILLGENQKKTIHELLLGL